MSRVIAGGISGPLVLSLTDPLASGGSDNPLIVTSTGTITSPLDGIDGAAGTAWTIFNNGAVSTTDGAGIALAGAGFLYNSGQGSITSERQGVLINGAGVVANQGSIFAQDIGVGLGEGSVINTNQGSIRGGPFGVALQNGGSVWNLGSISGDGGGVSLEGGTGSITNWGQIAGSITFGVSLAKGSVTNLGTISGGHFGVQLLGDGVVDNQGSIHGGVEIAAGGTVINQGQISDGGFQNPFSVSFGSATANNLLVIAPNAVFNGAVEAPSGSNSTIELTSGSGAISGIGEGQFNGFDKLVADRGANWTLNAVNTIGTVLNDASLGVSGSLDVTTAVDPSSKGLFQLDGPSTLEIAAALGTSSKIGFSTGSNLLIDNFKLFGENVGTSGYAGPLLENFGGSTVDLKDFSIAGLDTSFSASSGLLQLSNSASEFATLGFQTSSLGVGSFHFNSDGSGGVLITHV